MGTAEHDLSRLAAEVRDNPELHLADLAGRFEQGLELRRKGDTKGAQKAFQDILRAEPRLAEPRLELAHIATDAGDWEEAEAQARQSVEILRSGGQWIDSLQPQELLSFATNLLGEIIVREIEDSDTLIDDAEALQARWNEAATLFAAALLAWPTNTDAKRNSHRYPVLAEGSKSG